MAANRARKARACSANRRGLRYAVSASTSKPSVLRNNRSTVL